MMTSIKRVIINRLWDYKDIDCVLNDDVNILIGSNGTSKTTFLTITEAILSVDIMCLSDFVFESAFVAIEENGNIHSIEVVRYLSDEITPVFRYQIDDGEIVEISMNDYRPSYLRSKAMPRNAVFYLKEKISTFISVSWLSITRNENSDDRRTDETDVDRKLRQLMRQVVSYKLQLETQINERSKKYSEDLVSLLLYNEAYDSFPTQEEFEKLALTSDEEIRTSLHQAFSCFGDARSHSADIEKHVNSILGLKGFLSRDKIDAEQLLQLALLKRTFKVLSLTSEYQSDRAKINEQLKNYTDIVGSFIKDKQIEFNEVAEPVIYLKQKKFSDKRKLQLTSLSSGEKQLLILFTETLLQQKKPYVFMADEPELSLHIEWQRQLISSIRSLNPNAQIIFATHAPEIAGIYGKKIVNMEKITKYE